MPLLFLLLLLASSAQAQYAPSAKVPDLSFHGNGAWISLLYPDDRLRVAVGNASDPTIAHVPVFIRNCWRTTDNTSRDSITGFPITSFNIPIQFDSSLVEVVDIDTTGHASNFSYTWTVTPDTTYMNIVGDPSQVRQRGMRITIKGQAVSASDSLRLTGPPEQRQCDLFPFARMFSLVLRIKPGGTSDSSQLSTVLVIANDSLRYNAYRVFDTIWQSPQHRYTGLEGIDNYYWDANAIEQCRDPQRPSRYGMLWLEFTPNIPSIQATDPTTGSELDTVTIRIPSTHTWADTLSGIGYVDVVVSNTVSRSRATSISVSTQESWMRFRSVLAGAPPRTNPFPTPVRSGVIPYLDNGLLGTSDVRTLKYNPTTPQPPFTLRIFGNNTMLSGGGRYVGAITFESPSMRPAHVELPVVLIISDTITSVSDKGAGSPLTSSSITVAPNPSVGDATITVYAESTGSVDIIALDGRVVDSFTLDRQNGAPLHNIVVSSLSSGMYRAVLRTQHGVTSVGFAVVR